MIILEILDNLRLSKKRSGNNDQLVNFQRNLRLHVILFFQRVALLLYLWDSRLSRTPRTNPKPLSHSHFSWNEMIPRIPVDATANGNLKTYRARNSQYFNPTAKEFLNLVEFWYTPHSSIPSHTHTHTHTHTYAHLLAESANIVIHSFLLDFFPHYAALLSGHPHLVMISGGRHPGRGQALDPP